ncbi:prealbumin-like fold domain-containing protein [Lysobacter sp. CA199]|uniref:prealbumin-like fold domain-containing protein n=1 Tax=Lysobacter sp. CA199 TaxID=3455608 RepID=UPI003F8CF9B0
MPARRRRIAIVVLAIIAAMLAPAAQADRAFAPRYQNPAVNGDITGIGNINLHCGGNAVLCSQAQNGSVTVVNQDPLIAMVHVDVDTDSTTFNSSSANLNLPADSTVLFAGLYWSGISASLARNTVRLRPPGSALYSSLSADELLTNSAGAFGDAAYQGFEDVTAVVRAAGNGTYTVANVQTTQRSIGSSGSTWGGWALVIAYRDPAQTATRNLNIYDGLLSASDASLPVDIAFSGFVTPATGPVNTTLGLLGWDGDDTVDGSVGLQYGRNAATLSNVSNAVNPVNNFWNSSVSRNGANVGARTPNYIDTLGMDLDFTPPNVPLPNSANSALLRARGSIDEVLIFGMISRATDVSRPNLKDQLLKSSADVNGGSLLPGELLEFTIGTTNLGSDASLQTVLTDAIPANTTYEPGSLIIVSGANAGAKSDATGDDQAEFDAANNRVVFRLGTGATAGAGGTIAPAEGFSLRFRARVNAGVAAGTVINNSASVAHRAATLGENLLDATDADFAAPGDQPTRNVVAALPRLILNKISLRGVDSFAFTLTNTAQVTGNVATATAGTAAQVDGDVNAAGLQPYIVSAVGTEVAIAETAVPPGYALTSAVCRNAANAGVGALAGTVYTIPGTSVVADEVLTCTFTNTRSEAALSIAKSDGSATYTPGGDAVYTITVRNDGPDAVAGALIEDLLPNGASLRAVWDCAISVGTGACNPASGGAVGGNAVNLSVDLAGGATATITVPVNFAAVPEAYVP